MKRLLTAGIFGTILGIVGAYSTANASIVSSGFLDEKLTEMTNATTLQLDGKANQSDLTNLSNIVGTPTELTYSDILDSTAIISDLMGLDYRQRFGDITVPTNNISEFIKLNHTDTEFPGLIGIIEALFSQRSMDDAWPLRLNDIFHDYEKLYYKGFYGFSDLIIDGGTLEREDVTVYGLKDLTTKVDTNTAKIGTVPDGQTVAGMATTANTNANTAIAKIGTLPAGYDSVGAALSAIKGIAEDAKATALAAIPDPKQEGSSGKYVLTVDIVGDNATYHWEKIDREGEATTSTE